MLHSLFKMEKFSNTKQMEPLNHNFVSYKYYFIMSV